MMPTAPVWVGHPVFHYWGAVLLGLSAALLIVTLALLVFVWGRR